MYGRISNPGMGTYPPQGVLALCTIPSQSAIGQWGWGFHTVRGGFDPEITVFVPALSELQMYGEIAEQGMGTYPPRVRRDRGFSPRRNSHRARLAP